MMEDSKKGKALKSSFDSPTFDADGSITFNHNVGSASISPSGRDIALAATDGLHIIDLDSPLNTPRYLRHDLPWLVADLQWSPFAVRDYWVASTANQKALVWNLNLEDNRAIEHTLQGHSRAITDINFSAHHPDILATCAVDGYVHCWDLRRPRQAVLSFCDWFAGATQVKFNRQNPHILASSHDRWLRIWDDRMGANPLRSINAHESKIYGVDWNRTSPTAIVTCSLDKSIKFWDYENNVDEPDRIIRTDFPVWRARHTPFGYGLMAMPQNSPGELHLFDRRLQEDKATDSASQTVKIFPGHGNRKVREFLWRYRGGVTDEGNDEREFQLVSWGEDKQIRLAHVDADTLQAVGYVRGSRIRKFLNVTRKGATYKTFRAIEKSSSERKAGTITGPRPASSSLKVSVLSTGMKNMMPSHRTHMTVRAPGKAGNVQSSTGEEHDQKQIEWMSGIKISNYATDSRRQRTPLARKLSLLNPDYDDDDDWDSPETLKDEIIRISKQLPKILFENVDMDKRIVVVSMNAPWGEADAPIFIKATITFPERYPEAKAPIFKIGKTSLMSNEMHKKLKQEVHQMASTFASRQQGCLEATLCYLLGEVDLESSTTFFADVEDLHNDIDGLADESSSDEESDLRAGSSMMMSQELDGSATPEALTNASRNANMPLPRSCGARFSANGTLVSFFLPKQDKVKTLIDKIQAESHERSTKGEPSYPHFGRLKNSNSPQPRMNMKASLMEGSKDGSDSSEDSGSASSSDSDSTQFRAATFVMPEYWRGSGRPRYKRMSPTVLSQRSSAAGTGTGTVFGSGFGSGTGTNRSKSTKTKYGVTLHNFSDMLPAKAILTEGYRIFGDGPQVCNHNARVAEEHGYQDLANIWRYAALLLRNDIPLEVLDQSHRREPVFVIARRLVEAVHDSGSDSGIDVSNDRRAKRHNMSGRVKWGTSPLAKQLIDHLFTYFLQLGDVQMLAMLSCIFSEPDGRGTATHGSQGMGQTQVAMPIKTPAFTLDYFPNTVAAWSMYKRTPISSAISTPKSLHTPVGLYGSVGSSNGGAWGSDPTSTSYSCGDTPPLRSTPGSSEQLAIALARHTQSLSTSPENARAFRRANSGIASTFAASFGRPFTSASSTPLHQPTGRKRVSPVENMLSALAPSNVTWGNTTVLGSVKEQAAMDRTMHSDDEYAKDHKPTICTGITLTMENQSAFDDEGCMSISLLNNSHSNFFANYRLAYAELLYAWAYPLPSRLSYRLARLEVLKFNGFDGGTDVETDIEDDQRLDAENISTSSHTVTQTSLSSAGFVLGRKDLNPSVQTQMDVALDIAGYCLKHDVRLEPVIGAASAGGGGAIGRCDRCKTTQRQLRCTVCLEPISGRFVPCVSCGCAAHGHCLRIYHQVEKTTWCPGGCDCECGDKASRGLVESRGGIEEEMERLRAMERDGGDLSALGSPRTGDGWDEDMETWGEASRIIGEATDDLVQGRTGGMLGRRLEQVRAGDWRIPLRREQKRVGSLRGVHSE